MHQSGDDTAITAINVTPLVDIILVVLIIFMATAPIISRRAVKVDVPRAALHERTATEALQVVLNGEKKIFLSGEEVTLKNLKRLLSRQVAAQANVPVTLSADRKLAYEEIVNILDTIRSAGVRKIGLEVINK
jgi:biopolymer transport protein ExbD